MVRWKRALDRRITRRTDLADDLAESYDCVSSASAAKSNLQARGKNGDVWNGENHVNLSSSSSNLPCQHGGQKKGGRKRRAEPRFSSFVVSLTVPRPEQHTNLNAVNAGDGCDVITRKNGNARTITSVSPSAKTSAAAKDRNARYIVTMRPTTASSTANPANSAQSGSMIRLDVVRADAEEKEGATSLPRLADASGNETDGKGRGDGKPIASARSDSTARELLKWYADEQVILFSTKYFSEPEPL